MAGSDDRGLDLRLPWNRPPSRPAAGRRGPPPAPEPEPEPEPRRRRRPPPEASAPEPSPVEEATVPIPFAEPRDAADTARMDERLQRLELSALARFDRLEEQAEAHDAGFEARLEKLESRLEAAHGASVEAVGLLAGQLVARLEEQVAGVEAAMQSRHEQLVGHIELALETRHEEVLAKIEAARAATMEALGGVATGQLVDQLLEGVVTLGEVLDADLVNLRLLLTEHRPDGAGADALGLDDASPRGSGRHKAAEPLEPLESSDVEDDGDEEPEPLG